ncbi:nucleoporin 88 isoform X3 [Hydra vulgaris]|uniref:Nucleoporin 88 isoform X3 n=1 Tax=Hydra vulgaris TaxID=6087 RepID=A0ABM4CR92_HYDVU
MACSYHKPCKSFLKEIQSEIQETTSNESIKDLLTVNNGILLYWSEIQKCIYSISVSKFMQELTNKLGDDEYQVLRTSHSPLFDVSSIKCSVTGYHALVYGQHGIGLIELPRKWGEAGNYEGGKAVIHCKMSLVDESYYVHHSSLKIIQCHWYSGSPNDGHIVVLTNDNSMRFYDTSYPEQPILRISLFNIAGNPNKSCGSYASACGDAAVDFDIALPKIDKIGNEVYPIYVMQESGDVWVLNCKFTQNRLHVEHEGPLIMNPPSQDNYGCDYSSLLCMETVPTTIMIASKNGVIHHCLVLEDTNDNIQNDGTKDDLDEIFVRSSDALFVYESVQLDLTLIPSPDLQNESKVSDFLLKKDKNQTGNYIALSNGGVHFINLPWIDDISAMVENGMNCEEVLFETPAEVSYLLCTQPSINSLCSAINGCVLANENILCLLHSGEFTKLSIPKSSPHILESKSTSVCKFNSPLRQLRGLGSFDTHIANILKRNSSLPLIRSGEGNKTLPADDYYRLLTATTQILREEYLQKLIHAKIELEKRVKILSVKKEEQIDEINTLQNLNLDEVCENLAVKLESAQDKMRRIIDRLDVVLRSIRTSAPALSNEEKEWNLELKQTNEKLCKLRRMVEVVKSKHENIILQAVPIPPTNMQKLESQNSLSASQLIKVHRVLKEQEINIGNLIEETKSLSLKLAKN